MAKAKPGAPGYVERFEAFAAGMEIANSYTELNDPVVQRERFESQEDIRRCTRTKRWTAKTRTSCWAWNTECHPPVGGYGHRPSGHAAGLPAIHAGRGAFPSDAVD